MVLFRNIIFPIFLGVVLLFIIFFAIKIILKFFCIDIGIFKFLGTMTIWYYVGPVVYNWLVKKIMYVSTEGIEIFYRPIQSIMEALGQLV